MFFSGLPRLINFKCFPNLVKFVVANQALERIEGLDSCVNLRELWITECKLKVCVDRQMVRLENVDGEKRKRRRRRRYLSHQRASRLKEALVPEKKGHEGEEQTHDKIFFSFKNETLEGQ